MSTPQQNPDPLEATVGAIEKRARALFEDIEREYPERLRIALKFTHTLNLADLDTLMSFDDVYFLHDVTIIGRSFDLRTRQFNPPELLPECTPVNRRATP
jgi:hypothetical protein